MESAERGKFRIVKVVFRKTGTSINSSVTIPTEYVKALGIEPGDYVKVMLQENIEKIT